MQCNAMQKKKKKKKTKAWIDGKSKQWVEEGNDGFNDETQSLDRRMKPKAWIDGWVCWRNG